ncbi:tetratricopeptide repeat protein [uncultured Reyranella sp.]|uniref:tetratricopeptide repeat protein n=1 Tax=uncultured Reyranella sp. TaxID=735512 RepID=UPI0025F042C2|nr:tetratricopeptide repeat protein [uncultured Reyranella sp.]
MNRRQRKGDGKRSSPQPVSALMSGRISASNVSRVFAEAVRHHQAGGLAEAERHYRQVLAVVPHHADSLHLLGVATFQAGRADLAIELIAQALAVQPDYPEALCNLGNALTNLSRLNDAAASYRKALDLAPNYLEPLVNLGNVLESLGKPDEAIDCYRRTIALQPSLSEAHNNLGVVLYGQGRVDEAIASYERTLEINPGFVMALNNLAAAQLARGEPAAALDAVRRSLRTGESDDAKALLVACLSRVRDVGSDSGLRPLVARALSESWGRPDQLARVCISLIRLDPEIAGCVRRAVETWPQPLPAKILFGERGLAAATADQLLIALLDAAPVGDVEMERFLTMARRALLDAAGDAAATAEGLGFHSALARQCFINEYVFAVSADERLAAEALRESLSAALDTGAPVPVSLLLAVATYFPLQTVPQWAKLLEMPWPKPVASLLTQQLHEPEEERRLAADLRRLTEIDDSVSLAVQSQYEENPYPRWVKLPRAKKADCIGSYLRQTFPMAALAPAPATDRMEILVAGCGTGQHPIRTAQQFAEARVLAVDLSRNSLAYAARKTRELGISSIEYAQADLLKLGSFDRRFDVIEASGVLHHLRDPRCGWRTLLSLLKPGGFMLLGFYSEIARRDVVRLREFVAGRGYGSTPDEIRRCRLELMEMDGGDRSAQAAPSDMFSISACRDLLFHVQERCFTLTEIELFLRENDLTFIGFEIASDVVHAYRSRFPDDRAATDLARWQIFETENPDTFAGMYQFWIQKKQ